MTVHTLTAPPPSDLAAALERFEELFHYPLGPDAPFSVSHGRDYLPFFAAIGEATVMVAEEGGQVYGTLAGVIRSLRRPDGRVERVVYFADLKVDPRALIVMGRLFLAMREALDPTLARGYGVVMDGTGRVPSQYTGRSGLPGFEPLAAVTVLCLSATPGALAREATPPFGDPREGFVPCGGRPALRSEMTPVWLGDARASGLLEDTRRGKRLMLDPHTEMRAAHLSSFAFATPAYGARLLDEAASHCGVPTLFACVPSDLAPALAARLDTPVTLAPATVYGCGFGGTCGPWWIDSAEI